MDEQGLTQIEQDLINIKNQDSLFVRKILPSFSNKKYICKKKLYVIFIGIIIS